MDRLNVGGPARHAVWLTEGLPRDRFETTLLTGTVAPGEQDMSYFAASYGVAPVHVGGLSREISPRDLLVVARLLRHLLRLRPQIVHTHKAKAGAVGRVAAALYNWTTWSALVLKPRGCRVVHTYHGHVFHGYYGPLASRVFVAIERMLARLCTDRIVVVSEQQRAEIFGRYRVGRADQYRVIPLGLDLDEQPSSPARLRASAGVPDGVPVVGAVGRLCQVKNHEMLLRSFEKLLASGTRAHLVLVGDGHLRARLEAVAAERGIAPHVSFLGFRDDVLALYDEMDVVVLTSVNEGTPLTLIEAMSRGRAVAATRVGGVVDIMGDVAGREDGLQIWDHGVTTDAADVDGFADAMRFLIDRPSLRREMGERARAFVRGRASKRRLIADIVALYDDLLDRPEAAEAVHERV